MWSLYEDEKELKPLVFSNGKTQEDIVKEVIDLVEQGNKIIFIKGSCGSGKSGIALNLARHFGKTSIVVPIKSLQEQYTKDYSNKMFVLKKNQNPDENNNNKKNNKQNRLKISSIVGRQNFKCKYLEENPEDFEKIEPEEKDMKLTDIFNNNMSISQNFRKREREKEKNTSCDNRFLPCKIEIKEKNLYKIKDFIRKNPSVRVSDFDSIHDVRRMTIAPVCPYWSPIVSDVFEINKFKDAKKIKYQGLNNKNFTIYQRKTGCPYYEQYSDYAESDVLIFNSLKYLIETLMDRKPATEIEIIDECDEFLDSFSNQEQINLNRLLFYLTSFSTKDNEIKQTIEELIDICNAIKSSDKYKNLTNKNDEIFELKDTLIQQLLLIIIHNQSIIDEIDEEDNNYINHLDKVAKIFYDFLDETFFSIERKDNDFIINLVTTNLEKRLKEIINKNKIIVMMSGTIHSENVLKNIFGLDNFKIIEAETQNQGELIKEKYGFELDCSYASFKSNRITREQYLKALSKCIAIAKKPTLVHITSFSDLPTEFEKAKYNLDNLFSQEQLREEQKNDPLGERIHHFKNKKTDILFTTKCSRGMDFPGNMCNSIVITRFPYPDVSDIFWKILKKNKPQYFMPFYMDKARRELLQRIYRGLRSKDDKVYLLSPDIRVMEHEFG